MKCIMGGSINRSFKDPVVSVQWWLDMFLHCSDYLNNIEVMKVFVLCVT